MRKTISFQVPPTTNTISPDALFKPKPYKKLPPQGNASMEWEYQMRYDVQEITPGLYLGPMAAASKDKLKELKTFGITHIICVRQKGEEKFVHPKHPNDFEYKVIEMDEEAATEPVIPHFKAAREFLNSCFESGGKALVYGKTGLSGSGAIVVSYVMSEYGVNRLQAVRFVRSKRYPVAVGPLMMNQLREYEPIYQALHDLPKSLQADSDQKKRTSVKRSQDQDEYEMEVE